MACCLAVAPSPHLTKGPTRRDMWGTAASPGGRASTAMSHSRPGGEDEEGVEPLIWEGRGDNTRRGDFNPVVASSLKADDLDNVRGTLLRQVEKLRESDEVDPAADPDLIR